MLRVFFLLLHFADFVCVRALACGSGLKAYWFFACVRSRMKNVNSFSNRDDALLSNRSRIGRTDNTNFHMYCAKLISHLSHWIVPAHIAILSTLPFPAHIRETTRLESRTIITNSDIVYLEIKKKNAICHCRTFVRRVLMIYLHYYFGQLCGVQCSRVSSLNTPLCTGFSHRNQFDVQRVKFLWNGSLRAQWNLWSTL